MNGIQQKNHTTAVAALEAAMSDGLDTINDRLGTLGVRIHQEADRARESINDERTHRLKLAEEQRDYVDRENAEIRARLFLFMSMTFWQRLMWLLRGIR